MKNVLILGANGQIAKIVIERILAEQEDTHLTLFLRNSERLNHLKNDRVKILDGDVKDYDVLSQAMKGQDFVFVGFVDHDKGNTSTHHIIKAMKENNVIRVISSNVLGIYDEVPGEFGRWNKETIASGLPTAIESDRLLEKSGLDYTTLRIPWLNDRDEIDYVITHKDEEYVGVSGSRKSIADVVVRIIANPDFVNKESIGIANANTQDENRPVY